MHKGNRTTQPYRRQGGRGPGPTLDAMLKGSPTYLPNPQAVIRGTMRARKRRHGLLDHMLRSRG